MFGKNVKDFMSESAIKQWSARISEANTGKIRTDEAKKKYSEIAKSRKMAHF
ncbi:Seg-like homing endonuclease [Klebsiella phage EI]|nr:Seg-like homing endonuclease [Klebsiella phage EI]